MPNQSERDIELWCAVVLQAREDIETLPIGSTDYEAATAFLTSNAAYWRHSRNEIAAHIGVDGDALKKVGTAWVIARRRSEGLPDHPPVVAPQPAPARPSLRSAWTAPPPPRTPLLLRETLKAGRQRTPDRNPFNPFRRQVENFA
jgi:hypothetical protein